MSKREKFMLLLWFGGPKTAEEIAEHMQMPWREALSVDVRCVLKEKLLYRNFEDGKALYGLTGTGRDHCMRNYRAGLERGQAALEAEKAAATAVDGAADGDEAMTDAGESEGAAGGDQDADVDSTIAEQADPEAASHDAAESCDDFLLAIYGDPDGERTALELKANSNWAERATKLALETGQQVSVYRMKLVGRTRQQVVFEAA
jgi:hypothetical protein